MLIFAKDNVEASTATVATVRTSDRSDARRMPGNRQPIMNSGPNSTPYKGRFALALVTGNQQQNTFTVGNGSLQRAINRLPGPVERMAMKIERSVRLQPAATHAPVPASVERGCLKGLGQLRLARR